MKARKTTADRGAKADEVVARAAKKAAARMNEQDGTNSALKFHDALVEARKADHGDAAAVAREVRYAVDGLVHGKIELPDGEGEPTSFAIVRDDSSVYCVAVTLVRAPRTT